MAVLARHVVPRIAAAGALVVAVLTNAWLVNAGRELRGGLLTFESGGEPWSNAELVAAARANGSQDVSGVFAPAGQATLALGLLAAALLFAAALFATRWVTRAGVIACGLAFASAAAFLMTKPTGPAFGVSPGWSAIVFLVATATGVLSLARERAPT